MTQYEVKHTPIDQRLIAVQENVNRLDKELTEVRAEYQNAVDTLNQLRLMNDIKTGKLTVVRSDTNQPIKIRWIQ